MMWRNQSSGRRPSKRLSDNEATLSTINSILGAEDMLSKNLLSYLPPNNEEIDMIYPSEQIMTFIEMLHGHKNFFKGQTIHNALRDSAVLKKQIAYGVAQALLNSVSIQQIHDEWKRHVRSFPFHNKKLSFQDYFSVWAHAIKQVILGDISNIINFILQSIDNSHYNRYVDWICTVGIVPFMRTTHTAPNLYNLLQQVSSKLIHDIVRHKQNIVTPVLLGLSSVIIPDFHNIKIFRDRNSEQISCFKNKKAIAFFTYSTPYVIRNRLMLTTPLAHLSPELKKHNSLRRHQKMCQLLNTFPIKVLTTAKTDVTNKKIMDMIEKEEKSSDAKKSLIKFLLNLSDSKSKIGIRDSVEGFIQEITPSIIDQNKLMLNRGQFRKRSAIDTGERDVRDLFKKQIIKCMEEQIQTQMDEIETLKTTNQMFERKIKDLHSLLETNNDCDRYNPNLDHDLENLSLSRALNIVQRLPFTSVSIDDTRSVANSFFSQYIPDTQYADKRIDQLWEMEYMRTFRLRKNVNNQGQEESITYSNYSIELLIVPFLRRFLNIYNLESIPEEFLFLSLGEILLAIYESSKIKHYLRLVYVRELNQISEVFNLTQTHPENSEPIFDSNIFSPNPENEILEKIKRIRNLRRIQHLTRPNYPKGDQD
ncbi:U76 [Human betaherpesvirus 6A]|nr:U76 [Human betaherpesvirus 6A]CAA58368.2 U76 [Human betaherpesvirus 6A]